MVVAEIYVDMLTHWRKNHKFPDFSPFGLQERACFGLTAFIMQCEYDSRSCVMYDGLTSS